MQGDSPQHGYDLLTHLRRLETRIARLQKRWQTFRADPRPDRLEEFRTAFSNTDRALEELARRLGAGTGGGPDSSAGGEARSTGGGAAQQYAGGGQHAGGTAAHAAGDTRDAPRSGGSDDIFRADARSVVEAGRTLDQTLAEINRAWGFLRRDPDPDGIAGLADRLARAEAAAAVLRRVLPSTDPFAEDVDEGGPEESELMPAAGSLDSLLSRIRDDWQNLRRDPAPDRAGVLRGELAEARRLAEALRIRLSSPDQPDPDTARYLTGMDDAVRFAPYRDAFTGLYNREGFDTLAGAELKRCRRYSRSFGVLLLETHAPDLGELRGTIGTLQSLLRGYDLISRYSDRRLAIGLPEADGPETRRIAARLLRALETAGGSGRSPVRRLSYALMPESGVTLAALIEEAERGLEA